MKQLETTRNLYQRRLEQKIVGNKILEIDNVETAWQKIETNIIRAAEEALGKRKCNTNAKPNNTLWFKVEEEIRDQTTKASIISGYLRDIIWRNKHMSIKSKTRIYKTCIRLIMTYAVEIRAESTITKRILRTT